MNRFLVPAALAALLSGCALPDMFGLQPKQLVVVDSVPAQVAAAPTVIERDIYHEVPVVQVDTVYMEQEPVYVEEVHETYVYVSEPPPPPRPHNPRWSPRRRGPSGDDGSRERPDQPPAPKPPNVPVPKYPPKKVHVPVTDGLQKSPDRPTPPVQPTPPKRQSPVRGGSAPAAPVQPGSPKQVPTPPADKPAGLGSGA